MIPEYCENCGGMEFRLKAVTSNHAEYECKTCHALVEIPKNERIFALECLQAA